MRTICALKNLEPYGVVMLTGESDLLSYRILCDLTQEGRDLFCEAYGLPDDANLADAWNTGQKDNPHVASVLLDHDGWRQLGPIALLNAGCHTAMVNDAGACFGFEEDEGFRPGQGHWDDEKGEFVLDEVPTVCVDDRGLWKQLPRNFGTPRRVFKSPNSAGYRHQHFMSGRAE